MTELSIGLSMIVALVVLIYLGMHVSLALILTGFSGTWLIKGSYTAGASLLALSAADGISSYIFGVVPLFVLMGLVVSAADIGKDAFDAAGLLFRRILGGIGVATVAANAVFAAITGVSIASAAIFTKIAVPQMIRCGYKPRFAVGVVAGSSVLGMLIPPSLLLIIYGVLAEVSVGDLFIAGIVPGLLLAVVYAVSIIAMARFAPGFVGVHLAIPEADYGTKNMVAGLVRRLWPVVILVSIVLGGIYGGVFTPTEAGATGALASLVIAIIKRKINGKTLWYIFVETGYVTAAICLLFIAAIIYGRMLALAGVPASIGEILQTADLGLVAVITMYVLVIIAMGTILDSTSIMLVMLPIAIPVFIGFSSDLVWLGIVTVLAVEIGLLTPPLGISVFVIKAALDDQTITLTDIFVGAAPFVLMMVLVLIAVIALPWLAIGLL